MDLLEGLKMPLLNFKFVIIYIFYRILMLLKNHLNYLKDSILECFLYSVIYFFYSFSRNIFFHNI